jgi:hypothetical protein
MNPRSPMILSNSIAASWPRCFQLWFSFGRPTWFEPQPLTGYLRYFRAFKSPIQIKGQGLKIVHDLLLPTFFLTHTHLPLALHSCNLSRSISLRVATTFLTHTKHEVISSCLWACKGKKVRLSLCLTNYALRHEDVWGSGCTSTDPSFFYLGNSWK